MSKIHVNTASWKKEGEWSIAPNGLSFINGGSRIKATEFYTTPASFIEAGCTIGFEAKILANSNIYCDSIIGDRVTIVRSKVDGFVGTRAIIERSEVWGVIGYNVLIQDSDIGESVVGDHSVVLESSVINSGLDEYSEVERAEIQETAFKGAYVGYLGNYFDNPLYLTVIQSKAHIISKTMCITLDQAKVLYTSNPSYRVLIKKAEALAKERGLQV